MTTNPNDQHNDGYGDTPAGDAARQDYADDRTSTTDHGITPDPAGSDQCATCGRAIRYTEPRDFTGPRYEHASADR